MLKRPWQLLDQMCVLYSWEDGEDEDDTVVAICLNWGIAAVGDDVPEARKNLADALSLQVEAYENDESDIIGRREAREVWQTFEEAERMEYPGGLDAFAVAVDERVL
jgi:predicted RNase H-like HicB family nuclease